MKVVIIIVNFNGARFLKDLLNSIENQSYSEWEICIIDNNSSDYSLKIIREHPLFNQKKIKIFKLTNNSGFAKANNIGICNTESEFIAFINNDIILDKNWLSEMVNIANSDSRIGILASKIYFALNKNIINSAGVKIDSSFMPYNRGIDEEDKGQYDILEEVEGFYGAAGFIKRKVIEDIGLFNRYYFMYQEEFEFSRRAKLSGWKIIYNPNAIAYHYHSASSKKYSILKTYFSIRNYVQNTFQFLDFKEIIIAHYNFFIKFSESKNAAGKKVRINKLQKFILFFVIIYAYIIGIILSIPFMGSDHLWGQTSLNSQNSKKYNLIYKIFKYITL